MACDEGFGDGDGVPIESARAMVPVVRASATASANVRAFKYNLQKDVFCSNTLVRSGRMTQSFPKSEGVGWTSPERMSLTRIAG